MEKPAARREAETVSLYDYRVAQELVKQDIPFYALIMAAMRKADSTNAALLRNAFPEVWDETQQRYNAPGAMLAGD